MSIKDRAIRENPKLWENFNKCIADFTKLSMEEIIGTGMYLYKVKELNVDYTEPYMLFTIFCRLKEFNYDYKGREKTLYDIFFHFKNYVCIFSFEKTGLKLTINTQDEEVIDELFKKLNNAIKITNTLLSPIIKETINNGNFTLENHSGLLRQRYLYFRKKAEDLNPGHKIMGLGEIENQKKIIFNTQSMLDAYFSFQEHILILLLPFNNFDKNSEKISDLILGNWKDKYNRIFNPQKNRVYMKWFDRLQSLKELRNKYAHGGFEKKNGSFFPHIEGVGVIPVQPPENNNGIYSLLPINDISFYEVCKTIDEYENFLFQSEWKRPLTILESGLDIRYDDEYIKRLTDAIKSDENLESFLYNEFEWIDYLQNMDW